MSSPTAPEDDQEVEAGGQAQIPGTGTYLEKLIFILSILFALGAIIQVYFVSLNSTKYTNLHLMFAFIIFFLVEFWRKDNYSGWNLRDWASMSLFGLLTAGAVISTVYVHLMYTPLTQDRFASRYPFHEVVIGAVLVVAALYALYRAFGLMITTVAVFVLLYGRFGFLFPGILQHGGVDWTRLILYNSMRLEAGVYLNLVNLVATWVFVFIIWAGLVEEYGGMETFFNIGFIFARKFRSGVAQIAVVSSMIMGSINGSPMANAVVTGSFTIPLMKERGFSSENAAAIESVASTGGMVLPPVMGAVAFLMANFLQQSYAEIIIAAALPGILFYVAVALSVHLLSLDIDADLTIQRDVDAKETMVNFFPIGFSVIALVYLLLIARFSPGLAGVWTIVALVGAEFVKQIAVLGYEKEGSIVDAISTFLLDTAKGFRTGSVRIVPITLAVAGIGLVISTFTLTNIGFRLSIGLVNLAGGNVFILLLLVMVTSIILGMGMPTVAAYLMTITLVAPAMTEVGFAPITAHFFVFYFAMLASITPPIALVPAVTSKIADAPFLDVGIKSVILGLPLFILPYVFAFNKSIIVISGMKTVISFIAALTGFVIMILAIHGDPLDLRISGDGGRQVARGILGISGLLITFAPFLVGGI